MHLGSRRFWFGLVCQDEVNLMRIIYTMVIWICYLYQQIIDKSSCCKKYNGGNKVLSTWMTGVDFLG